MSEKFSGPSGGFIQLGAESAMISENCDRGASLVLIQLQVNDMQIMHPSVCHDTKAKQPPTAIHGLFQLPLSLGSMDQLPLKNPGPMGFVWKPH